jgi:hypothetical protein
MSEEKKETEFLVEPISDDELEDVSGGNDVPNDCVSGSGCCDGFVNATDS